MATVTGLTAERMQEIVDSTIVGAHIDGDDLILELFDATEINAGDVRGPQGIQGLAADVGDVKTSIATSLVGWFLMNGAAVANADTLYAALWALAPASWKSGTTLNLPNMADTVAEGGGTLGAVTGANTKTLVEANLPPHVHTGPSHTHTGPNHTHSTPDHTHPISQHQHSINHDHADATSENVLLTNNHFLAVRDNSTPGSTNSVMSASTTGGTRVNDLAITSHSGHDHTVNIPAFAGNTGTGGPTVTGSDGGSTTGAGGTGVTSASGTGNTGPGLGTSTPLNVEQKALRLNWFIYHGVE